MAWAQYLVHVLDSAMLWPEFASHLRLPARSGGFAAKSGRSRTKPLELGFGPLLMSARQELQRLQAQHDALHGKLQDMKEQRAETERECFGATLNETSRWREGKGGVRSHLDQQEREAAFARQTGCPLRLRLVLTFILLGPIRHRTNRGDQEGLSGVFVLRSASAPRSRRQSRSSGSVLLAAARGFKEKSAVLQTQRAWVVSWCLASKVRSWAPGCSWQWPCALHVPGSWRPARPRPLAPRSPSAKVGPNKRGGHTKTCYNIGGVCSKIGSRTGGAIRKHAITLGGSVRKSARERGGHTKTCHNIGGVCSKIGSRTGGPYENMP